MIRETRATRARVAAAMLFVFGSVFAATAARHGAGVLTLPRQHAARTVWDSVYTVDQATRGESSYVKSCARCHKASLAGADESPALAGSGFLANWNDQPVGVLHDRIRSSMPSDDPGTYSRELVTDVVAYMLKVNGFPAGAAELPKESNALKNIVIRAAKP